MIVSSLLLLAATAHAQPESPPVADPHCAYHVEGRVLGPDRAPAPDVVVERVVSRVAVGGVPPALETTLACLEREARTMRVPPFTRPTFAFQWTLDLGPEPVQLPESPPRGA